jgi:hypothetical protein
MIKEEKKIIDIDIASYPMNTRVNLNVKTNFGRCIYSFNYPPALEYELGKTIQTVYNRILNDLYEAHDARGGKYMGDKGCKAWMDENGETFVDFNVQGLKK